MTPSTRVFFRRGRRPGSSTTSMDRRHVARFERAHVDVVYRSAALMVRDVHCSRFHPNSGPEEHSNGHTIVLVRSGLFTKTTGGETVLADPNHVLFFTRHQPYHVTHPVLGGDRCTLLLLRPSDLLDVVRSYAPVDAEREDAPFPFTWALSTPRTFLLHHTLLARLRRAQTAPLAVEDQVFHLVDDLMARAYELFRGQRNRGGVEAARRHRALVEAAKLLIDQNVQHPPALGELADALGCSSFHLSRIFHREAGLPMRRYLDRCRLRTALERLAEGERDLTGLALDLGYADHSHFSNAFRREFAMSPSLFRRRAGRALVREARKNLQA